jgi:soluble lytic murein transglycosylase-like protein
MSNSKDNSALAPSVNITIHHTDGLDEKRTFTTSFRIGRDPTNDVHLQEVSVSRFHAEVIFLAGAWWYKDLGSANGTYVNVEKINRVLIGETTVFELGIGGPRITLKANRPVNKKEATQTARSQEEIEEHYFGDTVTDEGAGEHTIMVRRAFAKVQKHQKRKYTGIIAAITCLFLVAGGIAVYKHQQLQKQKTLAAEIFFTIKSLELEFSDYLKNARESKDSAAIAQVEKYQQEKQKLEQNYSKFIETIGVYSPKMRPEDRLVLKVARTFGECELLMPPDFTQEVHRYIKKWQATNRLPQSIKKAQEQGYPETITTMMRLYDLPSQFFYLALQESNFDIHAVGPETKYGIAKGMWQLIPSTAQDFGLRTGPLAKTKRSDPQDERQNFLKSTRAAAQYLRMIYDTDAQASGLLVVASYNWGQNRVNRLIREMPHNPKDRNFWNFLNTYRGKIPQETYDYVFYIFSAAVIGEDPALFGFDLNNPLLFKQ